MRRDPLRDAIEKLKQDFPGKSRSWIKRAIMRLGDVRELKFGLYLVEGRRELCDWKPLYQVWYSERGGPLVLHLLLFDVWLRKAAGRLHPRGSGDVVSAV